MAYKRSWLNGLGILCLLSVFTLTLSLQPTVFAQADSCASVLSPGLTTKAFGRVTPGNSNNVRESATKTGKLLGKIPGGDSFYVLDGPKCVDGLNWWRVRYLDFEGWTVEADNKDYWLEPYKPSFNVTTQEKVTHVEYDEALKLSFDFDNTFAKDVDYDFSIANFQSQSPLPEYICFNLRFDPPQEYTYNQLCVVRTTNMDDYVHDLGQILTDKPTFDPPDGRSRIPIPFNGAAQLIHTKLHYFDTDMLRGVSFVTYYAQTDAPVTNFSLEYNYSGLTKDGQYIIYFSYAITSRLISDARPTNALAAYVYANPLKYYKSVVDLLNPASVSDFTPNLDDLDAIIKSIQIK